MISSLCNPSEIEISAKNHTQKLVHHLILQIHQEILDNFTTDLPLNIPCNVPWNMALEVSIKMGTSCKTSWVEDDRFFHDFTLTDKIWIVLSKKVSLSSWNIFVAPYLFYTIHILRYLNGDALMNLKVYTKWGYNLLKPKVLAVLPGTDISFRW